MLSNPSFLTPPKVGEFGGLGGVKGEGRGSTYITKNCQSCTYDVNFYLFL